MKTQIIRLSILLITLFVSYPTFAQKEFVGKINQANKQGKKEGLWIENNTHYIDYMYYHNGNPNGMFYRIKKTNNSLVWLGELSNGDYSGIYYMFSDYGHLIEEMKDFQKNIKKSIEHQTQGICHFSCYCINYYPNGNKKSEGTLLFDDTPVMDSFEYGEWKYYDENGNLTKTKVFK